MADHPHADFECVTAGLPGATWKPGEVWMGPIARLASITLLFGLAFAPAAAAGGTATPPPLPPPSVRAWQTGLLRPDRLEHASFAFTLGLGVGLLSRQPASAAASALTLGLAKEVRDRRHGGFDPVDLATDAIGATFAALATHALTR
jgi:hypothetical protein